MVELSARPQDLKAEFDRLANGLEAIGLSPYESKAYIGLVAHGYGDAETIATTAGIPRTSSYKILQSLVEKGYAIGTEGRPKIFKPEPPSRIFDRTVARLKTVFDKLEMLSEIVAERGEPQLVYTITGREKVLEKIGELIDKTSSSIIISTPSFSAIQNELDRKIRNALKRKVSVKIVTMPFQKIPSDMDVVWIRRLVATDIVTDGTSALIASSDLNACGYIDNKSLAEHILRFLEILIDTADEDLNKTANDDK